MSSPETPSTAYEHVRETLLMLGHIGITEKDRIEALDHLDGPLPGNISACDGMPPFEYPQERKPAA